MTRILGLVLLIGCLQMSAHAGAESTDLWTRLAHGGHVVLLRHAMAPGFGDPAHFRLGDCTTQRNLSEAGRQQARAIGAALRQRGITVDKVYTSQWCRCRETAELLDLGPVEPLPMLNSFFQERQRQQEQTQALRTFLRTTPLAGTTLLVTHQVNIIALTGITPASGEAVLVEVREAHLDVLGKLSFTEHASP